MTIDNMISKGRHRAIARAVQFGLAGGDDKEQVVISFELVDPNDADVGRYVTAFMFFTDGTIDRTFESLRYLGWVGDDLDQLPDLCADGKLGNEVEIVIDHETYEGKTQVKVKWVNKIGGSVQLKKPLEGDALKRFSAQMKSRARMSSGARPNGGGTPRPAPHPNAPGNDDDLPF